MKCYLKLTYISLCAFFLLNTVGCENKAIQGNIHLDETHEETFQNTELDLANPVTGSETTTSEGTGELSFEMENSAEAGLEAIIGGTSVELPVIPLDQIDDEEEKLEDDENSTMEEIPEESLGEKQESTEPVENDETSDSDSLEESGTSTSGDDESGVIQMPQIPMDDDE